MSAYTDSEVVETVLALAGVWIHDPGAGGQETARWYPYGADQREVSLDQLGQASYYAGREQPVVDYGEHLAEEFTLTLDIPYGQTWQSDLVDLRTFAVAKRTLFFRDNRGRAVYGQMEAFRERDRAWGTQVSFNVLRTSWDTETVVV